jgi:hypothetical protein
MTIFSILQHLYRDAIASPLTDADYLSDHIQVYQ